MPHEHEYHLLDVFTRRIFGGNQLAVFTDGSRIPSELMPLIARELNLSETVFVLPPSRPGALRRVRIFTPGAELPFAGHPTVGTACLLALLGEVRLDGGRGELVLEQPVGDVRVTVRVQPDSRPYAQLAAARRPEIRATELTPERLARLLGLDDRDILEGDHGPAAASAGTPFLFVPLCDREALARCRLDGAAWTRDVADSWAPSVYVYALDAGDSSRVAARMFAPAMGIPEDPATGAAATALAALLATRRGTDGTHRWEVEQGREMGRPSILDIEADVQGGDVVAARVGGHAVLVGRGVMLLDAK